MQLLESHVFGFVTLVKKRDLFEITNCVTLQLLQTNINGAAKFFEK